MLQGNSGGHLQQTCSVSPYSSQLLQCMPCRPTSSCYHFHRRRNFAASRHACISVRSSDSSQELCKSTQEALLYEQSPSHLPVEEKQVTGAGTIGCPPPGAGGVLPPGSVLGSQGRSYTIEEVLGSGSSAVAYRASAPDGRKVAIKCLSFRGLKDWKQLELFQREARTLASLEHPGIPRYIDYFEEDNEYDKCFCIVQDEAVGASLGTMIRESMRCSDEEATRIGIELLRILSYLSSLRPPVIHRDVKPENIILEGGKWGGRVFLVDFGGVQGAAVSAMDPLGSTIIGTYGYMAPEQFRGAAHPASDVYAAGATLLFLLSGRPPSAFPQERMRIRWRGSSDTPGLQTPSARWAIVLDGLLEPLAEDRLTAAQALEILEGKVRVSTSGRQQTNGFASTASRPSHNSQADTFRRLQERRGLAKKPAGTRVMFEKTPSRLDITIPPQESMHSDALATGSFALVWNMFVAFWTFNAVAAGSILLALFSAPFWFAGVTLARQTLERVLLEERVVIGRQRFRIGQELAVVHDGSADFLGQTSDLQGARIITAMVVNGVPRTVIEVLEGTRKHRFGEALELVEQQWLVQEINGHIEALGMAIDFDGLPPPDTPTVYNDERDT